MPHPRLALCFTAVLAFLLLAACEDPQQRTPAEANAAAEPEPAAATNPAGQTDGTIQIGDSEYSFAIRVCDVSGESDGDYQTLVGRGTTDDGEQFDVFVSRNEVRGMLQHSISFQQGDPRTGEGTFLEASRVHMNDTWHGAPGEPDEPLIHIDGDRIIAEGAFVPLDDALAADPVDGRLDATCG